MLWSIGVKQGYSRLREPEGLTADLMFFADLGDRDLFQKVEPEDVDFICGAEVRRAFCDWVFLSLLI